MLCWWLAWGSFATVHASDYQTIEWTELIPEQDLQALMAPPENLNEVPEGDLADQISSELQLQLQGDKELTPYEQALVSTRIRPEFDQRQVRIPGFVVPLQYDEQQRVTEFFLVPFFGACVHYPPPPPNQIIFSTSSPGFELTTLMDAFWVKGKISTQLVENDMAVAAYSLRVDSIEPYYE
ncbi:hypothetical protein GCM10011297_32650 [Bacterioplanes sanyensis]|uniref:DUF3299 domain-containing protein n=1 Tax=Bacterioplanes sanyensis TaxID=1249553 RepID=UPI00167BB9A1|nr:DUF3299 domain-containing protein [Bacterioplanes sanyensis]GGY57485.1 hypothetical protein GCM10011297_32650 [Bacterioplanes sanyensis]